MKHFILTRYNCGWKPDVPIQVKRMTTGGQVGAVEWLESRRKLFEAYCLPSIRAQTARDFRLILAVSKDTPTGYFDFLDRWSDINIELHAGSFGEPFKRSLFDRCGGGLLLTTRLDNDDAIAPRFVERIRSVARTHASDEPLLIDVWGHQFLAGKNLFVVENYGMQHASQYCSVLSTTSQYKWVFEDEHGKMPQAIERMVKIRESLYVTVIHEQNLGNHAFRGGDANMDWFLHYCPGNR